MRLDYPDGQWVELRERITHGQDKEIRRARVRARDDPSTAGDGDTVALRVFIRDWRVLDVNGEPIALTDPDAIERMPMDVADSVLGAIIPLYTAVTVPNPPTPSSSDA